MISRFIKSYSRLCRHLRMAALLLILQALAHTAVAQVTIADGDTDLPDYSGYYQGVDALDQGDYETAIREFTASAEAGLSVAQFNLGVMYYAGRGVQRDYQKAYYWIREAAEQGHINAQFNLGTLYYNGLGMQPAWLSYWPLALINRKANLEKAEYWYQMAADQDHGEAQLYLATMYESGYGVTRDLPTAYMWARLADDNEIVGARDLQTSIESRLTETQLTTAQRRYAEWVVDHRS